MVQAQLAFPGNFGLFRMHIQTEGAAVELGDTDVDQVLERRVDGGLAHRHAQVGQRFSEGRCGFMVVNASAHCLSS
jgi:hypothetical protein